ncbi:hypothetical protein FGG08_004140 [Glutinoglossum americanum]|uniref:Uncharacterized protein n=1 Tax=Glutinoglossum americanum TaxID=1670608 RepID=A0A9P8I2X5_9PEZI|nr:hypothetical protein FGG08_004140 [Glutinoglossum americanum]
MSFLNLPRELRDIIYTNSLEVPHYGHWETPPIIDLPIRSRAHPYDRHPHPPTFWTSRNTLALLSTSRLICSEATHLLYAARIFRFNGPEAWKSLHDFLLSVGHTNRMRIREIHVERSRAKYQGPTTWEAITPGGNGEPVVADVVEELHPELKKTLQMLVDMAAAGELRRLSVREPFAELVDMSGLEAINEALKGSPIEISYEVRGRLEQWVSDELQRFLDRAKWRLVGTYVDTWIGWLLLL